MNKIAGVWLKMYTEVFLHQTLYQTEGCGHAGENLPVSD